MEIVNIYEYNNFFRSSLEEKIKIKQESRHLLDMIIEFQAVADVKIMLEGFIGIYIQEINGFVDVI